MENKNRLYTFNPMNVMLRFLQIVTPFLFLLIACGNGPREYKVKPASPALQGGCQGLKVSEEACIVEAVEAGFEVQVKLYRKDLVQVNDLDLKLLDGKGRPLNGWDTFEAKSDDIDLLNRSAEGYVSFKATDPTFIAVLIENLFDDKKGVKSGTITDKQKLTKKLRQSGAKRFVIVGRCR